MDKVDQITRNCFGGSYESLSVYYGKGVVKGDSIVECTRALNYMENLVLIAIDCVCAPRFDVRSAPLFCEQITHESSVSRNSPLCNHTGRTVRVPLQANHQSFCLK